MKKISTWAFYHPRTARGIMAVIKTGMVLIAWFVGNNLQQLDIHLNYHHLYVGVGMLLVGILYYPNQQKKKVYFEYHYYIRQKCCDAIITYSSFAVFVVAFNSNFSSVAAYSALPFQPTPATSYTHATPIDSTQQLNGKQKKAIIKKQLRQFKKALQHSNKDKTTHSALIIETVLAIVAASILGLVTVSLACSLYCSGSEAGAALVLALGLGILIPGAILWFRSIRNRRKRWQKNRANPVQPLGEEKAT